MKTLAAAVGMLVAAALAAEAGPPKRATILENEKVLVAEVAFEHGDEEPEHTHVNDIVGIAIIGGAVESTGPDGKTELLGGKPGDVFFLPKGSTHRTKNTSGGRVVVRVVVLK